MIDFKTCRVYAVDLKQQICHYFCRANATDFILSDAPETDHLKSSYCFGKLWAEIDIGRSEGVGAREWRIGSVASGLNILQRF